MIAETCNRIACVHDWAGSFPKCRLEDLGGTVDLAPQILKSQD